MYYSHTLRLVPAKIVRDWKMLFVTGRPLYDEGLADVAMETPGDVLSTSLTRSSVYADTPNNQLLDDLDFQEYKVGNS